MNKPRQALSDRRRQLGASRETMAAGLGLFLVLGSSAFAPDVVDDFARAEAERPPLVPAQVFMSGSGSNGEGKSGAASLGIVSTLVDLMIAEKSGFKLPAPTPVAANTGNGRGAARPATPTEEVVATRTS